MSPSLKTQKNITIDPDHEDPMQISVGEALFVVENLPLIPKVLSSRVARSLMNKMEDYITKYGEEAAKEEDKHNEDETET